MKNLKFVKGFTLMELMIVVVILSFLAAIGYPSYTQYTTRTHRADAKVHLLELTQWMERYFTEAGSYCANSPPDTPCTTAPTLPFTKSPKDGSSTKYTLSFAANSPGAAAFTLLATPSGAQATNDSDCGILSLDSTDVKCIANQTKCSNSGTASVRDEVAKCW